MNCHKFYNETNIIDYWAVYVTWSVREKNSHSPKGILKFVGKTVC